MPAPHPSAQSAQVHLRRDGGRVTAADGPWIRRRQIQRVTGPQHRGQPVQLVDRKHQVLGWGLYSEASSLAVRMLAWGAEPPAEDWLAARIGAAHRARVHYGFGTAARSGYRVINSEGDALPGLVVDRYGDDLVVQITTAPMLAHRDAILERLRAELPGTRMHILVPTAAAKHEGIAPEVSVHGAVQSLTFVEEGLRFCVDPPPAQKTGAYFDQRHNRAWVATLARRTGGALLDVGCHVGGFALHAAAQGVHAVGVDSSQRALARAAQNAAAAGLDVAFIEDDMFGPLTHPSLAGPFGTIVLDPPKIAARRSDVDRASAAMIRCVRHLLPRVAVGGHLVVCSCSHHLGLAALDRILAGAARQTPWTRVKVLGADVDHPVAPGHREGEYLTVAAYQRRA